MAVIECPLCKNKVNEAVPRCPECGCDPHLPADEARAEYKARQEEQGLSGAIFYGARRLGGTRCEGSSSESKLRFTTRSVAFGDEDVTKMSDVRSVELLGEEQAKSKVGAVILFGVLGGLAAKGRRNVTYLTVHLKSDDEVYYLVPERNHMEVRAALAPVLKEAGVPFEDDVEDSPVIAAQSSVADEIGKYFDLLQKGAITKGQYDQFVKQHLPPQ